MKKAWARLGLIFTLSAFPLFAGEVGNVILLPVAGRADGVASSKWRTDLVITNLSVGYAAPIDVQVTFSDGATTQTTRLSMVRMQTMVVSDFLTTLFGRSSGVGIVRISAPMSDAQLTARAVIFNDSGPGKTGQLVPATTPDELRTEWFVPLLTGSDYMLFRSNVGVSNPGQRTAAVTIQFEDGVTGAYYEEAPFEVRSGGVALIPVRADPRSTARVISDQPVLAWGSLVERESGSATFLPGVVRRPYSNFVLTPECAAPAILTLGPDELAEGWTVRFRSGVDVLATTAALAEKYDISPTPTSYPSLSLLFARRLTPEVIAGIRCEPSVESVSLDASLIRP